jgi:hypothetical protein
MKPHAPSSSGGESPADRARSAGSPGPAPASGRGHVEVGGETRAHGDDSSASPRTARVITAVERVNHWLEAAHIPIHGLEFLLIWWRKLGTLWMSAFLVALSAPVGGYSLLTYAATHSIPDWIGDFGVEFNAKEWNVHPFSLTAEARDVTLRRDSHSEPVFTAATVEFSGSLRTLLAGIFRRGAVYNEIQIRHGEVNVQQSLTGDWNWVDFVEGVPADRRRDAMEGLYEIKDVRFENLKIVYTEHVPGNSGGGGVIQTTQATIYIDDVNGHVSDLRQATLEAERPTGFQLKARTADGVIEMRGEAALFSTEPAAASSPSNLVKVSTGGALAGQPSGPTFSMKLYLENIGMGAFARMVPTTTIQPVKGTLRGNLELVRAASATAVVCRANLVAEDVQFAPNPRMIPSRDDYNRIQRQLIDYRMTGPYDPCSQTGPAPAGQPQGPPTDSPSTGSSLLAAFNAQTTSSAPVGVRALTAFDQQKFGGQLSAAALAALGSRLNAQMATEVSRVLGPGSGSAMTQALGATAGNKPSATSAPAASPQKNPVSSGAKSVGRSLKRLFGGGKKSN